MPTCTNEQMSIIIYFFACTRCLCVCLYFWGDICTHTRLQCQGVPGDSPLSKTLLTTKLLNRQLAQTHSLKFARWSLLTASLLSTEEVWLTNWNWNSHLFTHNCVLLKRAGWMCHSVYQKNLILRVTAQWRNLGLRHHFRMREHYYKGAEQRKIKVVLKLKGFLSKTSCIFF